MMKLYDSILEQILALADACSPRVTGGGQEIGSGDVWPTVSENSMILRSDMAYELGADFDAGLGGTILTDNPALAPSDEILVCGEDLNERTSGGPYARIAIVRVRPEKMGTGNALYNAIRKMEYVRYHFFPEGFMMRVSASKKKESVRISKEAVKKEICFGAIGKLMLKAFHEQEAVEAVRLIYVTDPQFDYGALESLLIKSEAVTETIDHMLKDLKMDCDICSLKPVCDEVEGLRELHFQA
jgi:CO dehydrogenase/acetyl-CoA synthase beta subunit